MAQVLGNLKRGLLFVLSAPTGTGKTTLVNRLTKEFPCVVQSVSWTTREPRPGEIDGVHYRFVTLREFEEAMERHEFIEWARVYDAYYGTPQQWVEDALSQRKHVVLVIDTQGADQVRRRGIGISIYITAPSLDELRRRLKKRSTESEEKIEARLRFAKREMEALPNYDYHIVNDELERAYQVLRSICIAEENRTSRNKE